MKPPSPLLGYNTNVRHRGRVYHIQTEDSGRDKPHVITHLFADGGRILSTTKTGYAEHLESVRYPEIVKQLMQDQHKAMFISLRAGEFDEMVTDLPLSPMGSSVAPPANDDGPTERSSRQELDVAALERAASKLAKGGYAAPRRVGPPPRPPSDPGPPRRSIAAELVREKSLDEVILGYLAEELDGEL